MSDLGVIIAVDDLHKGSNTSNIQQNNRSAVLHLMSDGNVHTRAELARITGLTQATITNIVSGMVEAGMIEETGLTTGQMGRRSIGIILKRDFCRIIAVKISRKSYDAALFNWLGDMDEHVHYSLDVLQGAEYAMQRIISTIEDMYNRNSGVKIMGVAVPGPFLREQGRIALMSEFTGWDRINIREELKRRFPIPICIEHDANAGALAEWNYGGYKKQGGVLVHLLCSEGIGAGIRHIGDTLLGSRGVFGEVGHMSIDMNGAKCVCGNYGCMELYCSALAFARFVREDLQTHHESSLSKEKNITAEVVFEHMRNGDEFSAVEVRKAGHYIGCGVANIINIYDPDTIVLSDIMTGGGEIMLKAIRETVNERILPIISKQVRIEYSALKHTILMGSNAIAAEFMFNNPDLLYQ